MRALRVQLDRLVSRQSSGWLLAVAVLAAALLATSAAYATRPADATEQATAQQLLDAQAESVQEEYAACLADPVDRLGAGSTSADCAELRTVDRFLPRQALDLADEVQGRGVVLSLLLTGLALLLGALFSGSDWAAGSIATELLAAPGRWRLWAAKGAAVALGASAGSLVVSAGFWLALASVSVVRGVPVEPDVWPTVAASVGRGVALVAAAALGAHALAMLFRSTVAPLALLLVYAVVGEGLTASLPWEGSTRWSLPTNVVAWLRDGLRVYDASLCSERPAGGCVAWYELTASHAAAYLGVLLGLAALVSVAVFVRRDV